MEICMHYCHTAT